MLEVVELLGTEDNIHLLIESSFGKKIEFENGCCVWLEDDDGLYWGVNPYGLDWACNIDSAWVQCVVAWVNFWNTPRDESGRFVVKS